MTDCAKLGHLWRPLFSDAAIERCIYCSKDRRVRFYRGFWDFWWHATAQWDRNPKGGNEVPSRSDESPVPEGDAPNLQGTIPNG